MLCYRAYLPFKKIVLRNRFVQQSSNSRNGSATRDSASAGGGAVGISNRSTVVSPNKANPRSGRTERSVGGAKSVSYASVGPSVCEDEEGDPPTSVHEQQAEPTVVDATMKQ
jgi:hypothetical protein